MIVALREQSESARLVGTESRVVDVGAGAEGGGKRGEVS